MEGVYDDMHDTTEHLPCTCACVQYVKDVDEDLARDAIRAVGQIALKVGGIRVSFNLTLTLIYRARWVAMGAC